MNTPSANKNERKALQIKSDHRKSATQRNATPQSMQRQVLKHCNAAAAAATPQWQWQWWRRQCVAFALALKNCYSNNKSK